MGSGKYISSTEFMSWDMRLHNSPLGTALPIGELLMILARQGQLGGTLISGCLLWEALS